MEIRETYILFCILVADLMDNILNQESHCFSKDSKVPLTYPYEKYFIDISVVLNNDFQLETFHSFYACAYV